MEVPRGPQAVHCPQRHDLGKIHLPLHLWLQAIHLMILSMKGINSHQLHRVLRITYTRAWLLTNRSSECLRDGALAGSSENGGIVEVDETFIRNERGVKKAKNARSFAHKMKTCHSGRSRYQMRQELIHVLQEKIAKEAYVMTDEAGQYQNIGAGRVFDAHGCTHHGVVNNDSEIHAITVAGFYSMFKHGMKGVYQHRGKQHLYRYAAEFDLRYNNRVANGVDDVQRGQIAFKSFIGKRLTYKSPNQKMKGS